MAKPTKDPRWMTDPNAADTTLAVEATEDKKDTGWDDAEKIPAQGMNWWMWLVWKWIEWLKSESFTATEQIAASAGVDKAPTGASAWGPPGGTGTTNHGWTGPGASGTNGVAFPISLPVGRRITAVRGYVRGAVGQVITMSVWKYTITAASNAQVGTNQDSASANTQQTLTQAGLTETIAAHTWYYVQFVASAGGSIGAVEGVEVDHDRP